MIDNIENKQIEIQICKEKFVLPEEIHDKIEKFWKEMKRKTPALWNGKLMCITSYMNKEDIIQIICQETKYAHYLYDERIGLLNEYACHSLGAGCLLETNDNYYILGELNENTSFPHCIQPCGGSVEIEDLKKGGIIQTIIRETKEELNIDLQNRNQVFENKIKYISLPENKLHTYMVFTKCLLRMSKSDLEEHYKNYLRNLQNNNQEVELCKLHFIKRDKVKEQLGKLKNPKREYLIELLEYDSKNN